MSQFYVSIIFIGITLILISFIWIIYDRKKSNNYEKVLDDKRDKLVEIIKDAEQMIDELNRFSDYIVTQMDIKNEELSSNLRRIDDELKNISVKIHDKADAVGFHGQKVVNGPAVNSIEKPQEAVFRHNSEFALENASLESTGVMYAHSSRLPVKSKDKVIPINSKYRDVIQLVEKGLNETEIAKKLNMGKGEIQLILELNK